MEALLEKCDLEGVTQLIDSYKALPADVIDLALQKGLTYIAKFLIEKYQDQLDMTRVMQQALYEKNEEMITYIEERRFRLKPEKVLFAAIKTENVNVFERYLPHVTDPFELGIGLTLAGMLNHHTTFVDRLLPLVRPNDDWMRRVIEHTARYGDSTTFEKLIKAKGEKPTSELLRLVAEVGDVEKVRILIETYQVEPDRTLLSRLWYTFKQSESIAYILDRTTVPLLSPPNVATDHQLKVYLLVEKWERKLELRDYFEELNEVWRLEFWAPNAIMRKVALFI